MSDKQTTRSALGPHRSGWVQVKHNVLRSERGLLKHNRAGWWWYRPGERAGRVGPYEKFQDALRVAEGNSA